VKGTRSLPGSFALRVAALVCAFVVRVMAAPIVVDDTFTEARVGLSMDLAYDRTGALTVDDVLAGKVLFAPSTKIAPGFGYRGGVEWARVHVDDRRAVPNELVLEQAQGLTDVLEVWSLDASGAVHALRRAGDHVPREERDFPRYRFPSVRVPPGTAELLIAFRSVGAHQLVYTLYAPEAFREREWRDGLAQWVYFGGLLLMGLYNLLVAVATRSRTYASYVAFLFSYLGFQAGIGGQASLFFPVRAPFLVDFVSPGGMALAFGTAGLFAIELLDLGVERPRIAGLVRAISLALLGAPPLLAVVPMSAFVPSVIAVGLLFILVVLGTAIGLARGGQRAARFYLLAWSAMLVGTTLNALRMVGVVPTNVLTANAQQAGSVIEFLLLSFALADRIKQLQQEVIVKGELALANANDALVHAEAAKKASDEALAAREMAMRELEERRRLQGELDVASQQLTQAENMATLGMLMAGIAHDIRNPIQAVRGAGELMSDLLPKVLGDDARAREESAPLVHEALGWIEQGTRTMDSISLAMRNQSRGGVTEHEPMNLQEVVEEALVLCRSRTKLFQVETQLEPVTIVGDATGVGQLVMNLASNAADALAEQHQANWAGRHAILIEARVLDGEVRIGIHDSGPGVPEAIRAKILEPFFTTKPRGQGTGLGLAIVQRVVKQHGGTLTIERSDALGGALFLARWPHRTGA
jgi:two-component system NtrC family sensor kinase